MPAPGDAGAPRPGRAFATLHLGPTAPPTRLDSPDRATIAALARAAPTRHVSRFTLGSPAAGAVAPLSGTFDRTRGAALLAAIEALPPERRALGPSGLPVEAIRTPDGAPDLCDPPHVLFETEAGGRTFEHRYEVPERLWMSGLRFSTYPLPEACAAALRASGGDVAAALEAGCEATDVRDHLPTGSTCRTCVEQDGDHARCVAEGACEAEARRQVAQGAARYDVAEATMLACAPDLTQKAVFLLRQRRDEAGLPGLFEHGRIAYLCQLHWVEEIGDTDLFCAASEGVGIGLSDVLVARVQHIRPAGDTRDLYGHRLAMAKLAEVDGQVFDFVPLFPGGLAEISAPIMWGGWGMDPRALRPGATDATDPRHTFAADWLAAVAVKTATRTDHVPIGVYNRNLCREGEWEGPDAEGRFHCDVPRAYWDDPPEGLQTWLYDWTLFPSPDGRRLEILPLVTLGATGEMDATIPGGHVPRVLGTPTLADPDWEACAWPEMFVPDEITIGDSLESPELTYTGQTWRFGAHPGLDLRVVLATNWRRDFCFEALEPSGP